jgi:hypothetical protein
MVQKKQLTTAIPFFIFVFLIGIQLSCARASLVEGPKKPAAFQRGEERKTEKKNDAKNEFASSLRGAQSQGKWFRYAVRTDEDIRSLFLTICFEGFIPKKLVLKKPDGAVFFKTGSRLRSGEKIAALKLENGAVSLIGFQQSDCAEIEMDLAAAVDNLRDWRKATRIGETVLLDPYLWLWRPNAIPRQARARLTLNLPADLHMSHPWQHAKDGSFILPWHAFDWPAIIAIGPTPDTQIKVPGGVVSMNLIGSAAGEQNGFATDWITDSANAVTKLYGQFPRLRTQVLLIPAAAAGGGAIFGLVKRGGGMGVHILVSEPLQPEPLSKDWIAVHEMSHLFVPFTVKSEIWFSEGIATYYQNVLRARANLIRPEEAWTNLWRGFASGRQEFRGRTLGVATEAMGREGIYLRVYWGGTAVVFAADLELRRKTQNQMSVDQALKKFSECCLSSQRYCAVDDLLEKLDEKAGDDTFVRLAEELAAKPVYPDFTDTWKWLGVSFQNGSAILDPDAPGASVRDAIMQSNHP